MRTLLLLALVALAGLCGCSLHYSAHPPTFGLDLGIHPPTNAIVAVTVKKIGIVVGENPATQIPELTLGYQSATYHRVPIFGSNVPIVNAEIGASHTGLTTDIHESFSTGK